MEEQSQMLNNAIQLNTQLCGQNAEQMEATFECHIVSIRSEAMKMNIFNLTYLQRNYDRAMELDNFLDTLRSNFQPHMHIVPPRVLEKA